MAERSPSTLRSANVGTDKPDKPSSVFPVSLLGWLDLGVKVGAVFAAIFAIYQYLEAKQVARTARTLDYVGRFGDPDTSVGAASQRVAQLLWENDREILELVEAVKELPPAEAMTLQRQYARKLVEGTLDQHGIQPELHEIADFFESLVICIERRLCDRDAALAFFGRYLDTFWRFFWPFFEERRQFAPALGQAVEKLRAMSMEEGAP
jgi:hypothetical protein